MCVCNYFLFLGSLTRSLYLLRKYTYVNVVYTYASKIMCTYACIGVTWISVCWLWVKKNLGRESPPILGSFWICRIDGFFCFCFFFLMFYYMVCVVAPFWCVEGLNGIYLYIETKR